MPFMDKVINLYGLISRKCIALNAETTHHRTVSSLTYEDVFGCCVSVYFPLRMRYLDYYFLFKIHLYGLVSRNALHFRILKPSTTEQFQC